jgi:hypothetical protein
MHSRTQVSCEDPQMIKMRACCTWKRQDQSVAEAPTKRRSPSEAAWSALLPSALSFPEIKPARFGYRLNLFLDYELKPC